MKPVISILAILFLAACVATQPIQPTGPVSNTNKESAVLASYPICRSVRSTFWGGGRSAWVTSIDAIATDNNGHVYVAGMTTSPRLPGTQNGFQPNYNPKSSDSGFVAEFSQDLRTLIAATYLGGPGPNEVRALAVGKAGEIYAAGQMGVGRAFIAVLTQNLSREQNFILAKAGPIRAMVMTPNEKLYVVGGGSSFTSSPEYIVEFNRNLKLIEKMSSFGGGKGNWPTAVAVSQSGDVYLAGDTSLNIFPKTNGGTQANPSARPEAYVVEFSSNLRHIVQATYFGANGRTSASTLAVSKHGRVYLSGYTSASDLPGTAGAAQPTLAGGEDAYVTELSSDLKSIYTHHIHWWYAR